MFFDGQCGVFVKHGTSNICENGRKNNRQQRPKAWLTNKNNAYFCCFLGSIFLSFFANFFSFWGIFWQYFGDFLCEKMWIWEWFWDPFWHFWAAFLGARLSHDFTSAETFVVILKENLRCTRRTARPMHAKKHGQNRTKNGQNEC